MGTVTVVFLVFDRREELRTSLTRMLEDSDYPAELVDVVVVDNASQDGVAEMLAAEFPQVQLVRREVNCGVSGWNDGFAVARGDWVLALDDDCYLPSDGLRRAVEAAEEREADVVSFAVRSLQRPEFRFTDAWIPGLLAFWGCAVLLRRPVLERLGGYDPEIFVWANELEFMMRALDAGFTHLHFHEVVAVHMKDPGDEHWTAYLREPGYRINAKHFAYIAGKLMQPSDAAGALVARLATVAIHGLLFDRAALRALRPTLAGFRNGLRHRAPLSSAAVSRTYRRCFHSYASPWWTMVPLPELLRTAPGRIADRLAGRPNLRPQPEGRRYFEACAAYYPSSAQTLSFAASGAPRARIAAR